jgi:4-hydroxymandelate synthase
MALRRTRVFNDMHVAYIEFYVGDLGAAARWLADGYGLAVRAVPGSGETAARPTGGHVPGARSLELGKDQIRVVLTQALVADHPAAAYVRKHGDGVADIALTVSDAVAAFDEAVRRGARAISPPARRGSAVTATIAGFGDVTHTFVQHAGRGADAAAAGPAVGGADTGLRAVDHFAVVLEPGHIGQVAEFYQRVLDFELIFHQRIVVGSQAIVTTAVQSRSAAVTLTLIEPDVTQAPGHVDEFLANHGGPGVQHIAFTTDNIVDTVRVVAARGVEFLQTPDTYYSMLSNRLELARYSVDQLYRLNILVDQDHDGQLLQIFSRSVHPRNTIFIEIIERLGARSFGNGNIKALYEAVEHQRDRDEQDEAA